MGDYVIPDNIPRRLTLDLFRCIHRMSKIAPNVATLERWIRHTVRQARWQGLYDADEVLTVARQYFYVYTPEGSMTAPDRSLDYSAEVVTEMVKAIEATLNERGVNNAEAMAIAAVVFARTVYWLGTLRWALSQPVPQAAQETLAAALRWVETQEQRGLVPLA